MTLREAPVDIVPYDPSWPRRFAEEAAVLNTSLAPWLVGPVEHIGSTAIPGLAAKPVIDILAPVRSLDESRPARAAAADLGYIYSPYEPTMRHWFCKPSLALRTHHLHMVPIGTLQWNRPLAFRDYLRTHGEVAAEYEALKYSLAERFRRDREAYTAAKSPFIERITHLAMAAIGQ